METRRDQKCQRLWEREYIFGGETKMASSLEELAKYFDAKTAKMKRCLELRGIGTFMLR